MNGPMQWVDRSDRFRLLIKGPDRLKFLHNLTTNEIKRLAPDASCEAFVTSPQGKTLGFVQVHNFSPLPEDSASGEVAGVRGFFEPVDYGDTLLLRGDAGAMEILLPHLEKYGMFDDVTLTDLSGSTVEFHVFGPGVDAESTEAPNLVHGWNREFACCILLESPTGGPGMTIIATRETADEQRRLLEDMGCTEASIADFDALRILAGTPVFGRDITPDNLPQEVGRDDSAISFVKGCYLGQETVARIDALGHVNKILRGFRFSSPEGVAPGVALGKDGKSVGTITSTAVDPRNGGTIGLGYVRVQHADAGTTLDVMDATGTTAVVNDLPFPENIG